MSLIHWWPLIDNLNSITSSTPLSGVYNGANGKIGQCLSTGSRHDSGIPMTQWNPAVSSVSMACWIKISYDEIRSFLQGKTNTYDQPTGNVIGYQSYSGLGIIWFANSLKNFSTLYVMGHIRGNGANTGTASYVIPDNQWIHTALVADIATHVLSFYVNGVLVGTTSYAGLTSIDNMASRTFGINVDAIYGGNGPRYTIPLKINDVRLYNHALTKKEITELAKGLAMHLRFDGVDSAGTINNDPNKTAMSTGSIPEWSRGYSTATFGEYYGYKCFKIKIQGTHSSGWVGSYMSCNPLSYGFKVGDRVTRSCYIYVPSGQTYTWPFDERVEGSSSNQTFVQYDRSKPDTWQRVSSTVTITGNCNMLHYFMAQDGAGSFNLEFYIRDFQLELGDCPTSYTEDSRPAMLVDNAGLQRVTEIANYSVAPDAPIGLYSGNFNQTMVVTSCNTEGWDEMTMAAWVKPTSWNSSDQNAVIIGGAYLCIDDSQRLAVWCYGRNTGDYYRSSATVPLNAWTHLAASWHKDKVVGYINGQQVLEVACSGPCTSESFVNYNGTNATIKFIGTENSATNSRAFRGQITDARIYATALSTEDIQELYKMRWAANKEAQVFSNVANEGKTKYQITKSGVANCNTLYETYPLPKGFIPLDSVEVNRNSYINTGFIFNDATKPIDIVIDATARITAVNSCFMGCGNSGWFGPVMINFCRNYFEVGVNGYSDNRYVPQGIYEDGERVVFQAKLEPTIQHYYKNGIEIPGIVSRPMVTSTEPLYIGGFKYPGGPSSGDSLVGKIHYVEISYNGTTKKFVPCKQKSNNELGLYDIVGGQFYNFSGAGTRTEGPAAIGIDHSGNTYVGEFNEI